MERQQYLPPFIALRSWLGCSDPLLPHARHLLKILDFLYWKFYMGKLRGTKNERHEYAQLTRPDKSDNPGNVSWLISAFGQYHFLVDIASCKGDRNSQTAATSHEAAWWLSCQLNPYTFHGSTPTVQDQSRKNRSQLCQKQAFIQLVCYPSHYLLKFKC
jgi:hypothetical protein